ncbi:MAG: hypothetical protein RLT05_29950 [Bauldia litoralis]
MRSIVYIPGLDPAGSGRYYKILCREAERHNKVASSRISIDPAATTGVVGTTWRITQTTSAGEKSLQYFFLDWSDIVRRSFAPGILRVLFEHIFSAGLLARIFRRFNMKTGRPFALVCTYAILVVALYISIGVAMSATLFVVVRPVAGDLPALALSALLFWIIMKASLFLEPKLFAYFFLRTLNFSRRFARPPPAPLRDRLSASAAQISRRLNSGEEVVIVGHSYGALLTSPLVECLLDTNPTAPQDFLDRLRVIHLGALHPLITLDPAENWYKRSIDRMAASGIRWIEVFSGYDALNFPGYDPRSNPRDGGTAPAFRDVNFFEYCNPSIFSPRRYRIFRNHFRYLMARDRCCQYDYFDYLFADDIDAYWNPPPEPASGVRS